MSKNVYHLVKAVCSLHRGMEHLDSCEDMPSIANNLKKLATEEFLKATEHIKQVKDHEWGIADDAIGHYCFACINHPNYAFRKLLAELEVAIEQK